MVQTSDWFFYFQFTTSNYALLDSNTAVNRKTLSKLATAIEKKPIPKEKRLNPTGAKPADRLA
jgi:hypothetical protein